MAGGVNFRPAPAPGLLEEDEGPSKWAQTWEILKPYVTGPATAVKGLMDADLNTLLYDTGPAARQAVENSFNAAGAVTGGSSVASKPANSLNMGFRVFHGSPHDFPPVRLIEMADGTRLYQNMGELADTPQGAKIIQEYPMGRFDLSKIGTGEGAQAYGHGLYFAEGEDIARHYRDALSSGSRGGDAPNFKALGNKPLRTVHPDIQHDIAEKGISAIDARLAEIQDILKNEKQNRRFFGDEQTDEMIKVFGAEMEELNALKALGDTSINKGHMYEVEINADPDTFLDWDKPLSEQPEAVRKAYAKAAAGDDPLLADLLDGSPESLQLTGLFKKSLGAQAYNTFVDGNKEAATQRLREAGIPGIKYLDAGSRGAGDGTRNYVVFDDRLVSIVRKYGIAGLLGMGAAGNAMLDQPQEQY